jgi:tellurite resistance protein
MQFPRASAEVVEAIDAIERYGPMCEAMYLVMAADGRVLNVEREVLRGALEVLGEGHVRTAHMESMLDAAARASASQGGARRLAAVIEALQGEPVKAELVCVLCAAVALADKRVSEQEQKVLESLAAGVGLGQQRAAELLQELEAQLTR